MHILMTGASGLIGRHLCHALVQRGDHIMALSRYPQPAQAGITWHIGDVTDPHVVRKAMLHCTAAINLAGASVAHRWTAARKKAIAASRLQVTRALVAAFDTWPAAKARAATLLSASAVGYYGYDDPGPCSETAPAGRGFLADICREWEAAAQTAEALGVRCVRLRLGVVLAREGGALPQMVRPIAACVGAALGTGQQWMSWVHIDDVVGLFLHALDSAHINGPLNVVAPAPATNAAFTAAAARILRRPLWFPRLPRLALEFGLGAMAKEILLGGQRVVPQRAVASGYAFRYPELQAALAALLCP